MDHKREDQTPPPLARVMGVGRQQQLMSQTCDILNGVKQGRVLYPIIYSIILYECCRNEVDLKSEKYKLG